MGYIYILTNPSFPDYVKIGYADDVEQRLQQLNRSECTPFAFRVYATYEVSNRLTDMKIHDVIDKLNPNLRSIDNVNGKKRVREFYAMTKEDAYSIFEAIAEINGLEEKLKIWQQTEKEKIEEETADEIKEEQREKMSRFMFSLCNILPGETVEFCRNNSSSPEAVCTVVDDKHVSYMDEIYSLSSLAAKLLNSKSSVQGPKYFKYKGEWLNDIRQKVEKESQ